MSYDYFQQGSIKDPVIQVGKSKFRTSFLREHIPLDQFGKLHPCKKCTMPCDDSKPICDECIGVAMSILESESEVEEKYLKDQAEKRRVNEDDYS